MANHSHYAPIFETTRGGIVESLHFGAFAVVDSLGNLIASHGDPFTITYLRSSAKPFQALPLIEAGGVDHFKLIPAEVALMCASHSGTQTHLETVQSIQNKIKVSESELLCGIHSPLDKPTAENLRLHKQDPTPNYHNCSGKHTGMLAYATINGWTKSDYINPDHPIQVQILKSIAEMCNLGIEDINIGIDGCSVPNFAVPLYNAAFAYARLCDPSRLTPETANACQTITSAMLSHPDMVAGPGRFDTILMGVAQGNILSKGGAEGYQGIGIMPGVLSDSSPGLGLVIKISDGDLNDRVRPPVSLEILSQLCIFNDADLNNLDKFKPRSQLFNWRKIEVGYSQPTFGSLA